MQYHYTYLLTCDQTKELYMGVRTSKISPKLDHYWSSSRTVKAMMKQGLTFSKKILEEFSSRELAGTAEIDYHKLHNVDYNSIYLNKAKALSTGFSYGMKGKSQSEAQRKATANANSNRTPEQKAAAAAKRLETMRNRGYTFNHTEEFKEKARLQRVAMNKSPEHIAKITAAARLKKTGSWN